MGWFRLSGTFADHWKVVWAGNAAVGAFVRLGCWTAEHETDGFVPTEVAKRYGSRRELARLLAPAPGGARPLLQAVDGGFLLRDFLMFNPSHEAKQRDRARNAERQSRHRSNGVSNAVTDPLVTAPPLRSAPLPISTSSVSSTTDEPAHEVDIATQALQLYADHVAALNAAPRQRRGYARTVVANADDHFPALLQIARSAPSATAQDIADAYIGRAPTIVHSSDCACGGDGWVPADPDHPNQGVVRCQEGHQQ